MTHNHYINGVWNFQTFQNGVVNARREKTFWDGVTTMASVSGAGPTYATYYCD